MEPAILCKVCEYLNDYIAGMVYNYVLMPHNLYRRCETVLMQ